MIILKRCTACGDEKDLLQFRNQAKTKDGKRYRCAACDDLKAKEYYNKSKQKRLTQIKTWQDAHKEKVLTYQKTWRDKSKTPPVSQ